MTLMRLQGLILLSLFLVCVKFPKVSGDCYDEPPNNSSYDNCATCYQTFANALVNTADNIKYRLSRTFFPIDAASPVEVEVLYESKTDGGESRAFYWVMGGFYVFQPLDVFLYRSLFFSHPNFRKDIVTVFLPEECFDDESNFSSAGELYGFFEFATQRLKAYAMSQSETPDIDNTYVGLAVGKSIDGSSFYLTRSDDIIAAAYGLPFFVVLVVVVIVFLGVFFMSLDEQVISIKNSVDYQANIISLILLCIIFTVFTTVLDIQSCIIDVNQKDLPVYYSHSDKFLGVTITGLIIYLLFFVVGILWFMFEIFVSLYHGYEEDEEKKLSQTDCEALRNKIKVRSKRIALICVLIIGGALLSITAHFPSILMAWATDAFYASRIALFYGVIIFCYFSGFHYTYVTSNNGLYETGRVNSKKYFCFILPFFLLCSFVAVSLVVMIITLYVVSVPVNNSIETTSDGVTSIYNGVVILIGALLAYKIGWQYFGCSFSVSDALEKALKDLSKPPLGVKADKWGKLTEEKRLTEIMKSIAENKVLTNMLQTPPPPATPSGVHSLGTAEVSLVVNLMRHKNLDPCKLKISCC